MNNKSNANTSPFQCQGYEKIDLTSSGAPESKVEFRAQNSRAEEALPLIDDSKWYAIYTKSRFEKKICSNLQKTGFNIFLPLVKEKRTWSDRIKTVQVPLIPSYVFIKIMISQFPRVYYYPGFVRFVSFEGKPSEIREDEINLLKEIVAHGFHAEKATDCKVGERVRIVRGPLKDWEGRVECKKGRSRVVFQFESMHQAIIVEVELSDIEKVV